MASNLEMLYKLLNGEEAQAAQPKIKKQEPIVVEDSPINLSEKLIADPSGAIKSKVGQFYMQNLEPRAQEAMQTSDIARSEKSEAQKNAAESRAFLKKQIEEAPKLVPYQSKYEGQIQQALADVQGQGKQAEAPSNGKDQMLTSIIQAFGGGLLGAATGGEAGWKAGSAAGQVGIELMKKSQERAAELEKIRLQKGEKVHTEKLKALLDMEKHDADRYNKYVELQKDFYKTQLDAAEKIYGKDSDQFKAAATNYKDFEKAFQQTTLEAVKAVGGAQIEEEKMQSAERRAQMIAEAQGAKLNMPTQAERQAAALYSRSKANNDAYEKLEKKYNGKMPSTESRTISMLNAMFQTGPVTSATILASNVMDPQEKEEMATRLGFIAGLLRGDTGAAVSATEFKQYDQQYFGQYGDTPEVLKRKAVDRRQALEGMKLEAGRAEIPKILTIPTSADKSAAPKVQKKTVVSKQYSASRNKTKITYSDGSSEILDGQK